MTKLKYSLLLLLPLLLSCSSPMSDLELILHEWSGEQGGANFTERWEKVSDTEYKGTGVGKMGEDTVFKEFLKIEQLGEEVFYVANPNNEGPVHFKLTSQKNNMFTFEKPDHDFPKTIIYNFKSEDSLLVQLLGNRDGQQAVEQLVFTKKK